MNFRTAAPSLTRQTIRTLILTLIAWLAAGAGSARVVAVYENSTSGAIGYSATPCSNPLVRAFQVTDTFGVESVALGFNASHTRRGDIRATLVAPNGASLQLISSSSDSDDNYDILISSNSEGSLDDNDADPVEAPYFNRLVSGPSSIDSFYTGPANGTWTLQVCDTTSSTNGTFHRARLVLGGGGAVAPRCTSRAPAYNWGANGAMASFSVAETGGVTIRQGATSDAAGTASTSSFTTVTSTLGGQTGYYALTMDASATAGTQDNEAVGLTSSFTFDPPVSDLSFALLDVDASSNAWEDQVAVAGYDASGRRLIYSLDYPGSTQIAGEISEGDASVDASSAAGNVNVVFSGAVTRLELSYTQGSSPSNENSFMVTGLGDLSFCAYDFGDAPASYGTALADDGARHLLAGRALWIGQAPPDGEADGSSNATATADDTAQVGGVADESVPTFGGCPNDGTYSLQLDATNLSGENGYLVGYIDWNRDGDFRDAGERSVTVLVAAADPDPSTYALVWTGVPAACGGTSQPYARFRLSTDRTAVESPTGAAPDGEVEDTIFPNGTLPVTLAYLTSERTGGDVVVRWTTASESANAGFRVWGVDAEGRRSRLGRVASAQPDSFVAQHYELRARATGLVAIALEDVALVGENRLHGPFTIGTSAGEEPMDATLDWAAIKAEAGVETPLERVAAMNGGGTGLDLFASPRLGGPGGSSASSGSGAREGLLLVHEPGIHRVTHEQLLASGIDLSGAAASTIAVLDRGLPVVRHVETVGRGFGPGSFIEFVAEPRLTLASPVDVYVLKVQSGKLAAPAALVASPGTLGVTEAVDRHHADRAYSYSAPNGDPWYEQGLLAWGSAARLSRTFDLPDLAEGDVTLRVSVWGYGDWPGTAADHHVVISVNGVELADRRFDGISSLDLDLDATRLVSATGNVLEVRVPGDTGFAFDYVAYEGFDVTYPRETMALEGRFAGSVSGGESVAIGGFDGGELVSVWSVDGHWTSRALEAPVAGQIDAPTRGTVYAASASALRVPGIVAGVASPLRSANAEYLIVTHPALAEAARALVDLEEERGFRTELVTVDRIFAAYSDHAASADALRSFLTASAASGRLQYVLLVGADTTDPYDHLGLGSVSYVPTAYLDYAQYVSFSPSDEALVDANDDGVGEVPIGRLPVRTPAELEAVVAKLQRWEANAPELNTGALLVAGASDGDQAMTDLAESYASSLQGWETALAPVDELGVAAARDTVLEAMNLGTPLVSYVGHSSRGQWDFTPLLKWQDVAALRNADYPNLVTQWGCWNAYYVEPASESLASRLLVQPNAGAAGVIGAMTLTSEAAHQALGNAFFRQVGNGARTVGEAFHAAKREIASSGTGRDALLGMAILGDPAMTLPGRR